MAFETIAIRPITRLETEIVEEANNLLRKNYDRRELSKLLGLTSVLFFTPLIPMRSAHAFVPAGLVALRVLGSGIARGAAIAAALTVSNTTAYALTGLIEVRHIEPSGNIAGSDSTPVTIPPNSTKDLRHTGFRAKTEGTNVYQGETDVNELEDSFEVVE